MLPPEDKLPPEHCVPPPNGQADRTTESGTGNVPLHIHGVLARRLGWLVALRRVRVQLKKALSTQAVAYKSSLWDKP
jgi:hypothetical protein